jgi:hypothetical protein
VGKIETICREKRIISKKEKSEVFMNRRELLKRFLGAGGLAFVSPLIAASQKKAAPVLGDY